MHLNNVLVARLLAVWTDKHKDPPMHLKEGTELKATALENRLREIKKAGLRVPQPSHSELRSFRSHWEERAEAERACASSTAAPSSAPASGKRKRT